MIGPERLSVLHVVVGAGIPRYFVNAIESVLSVTPHDVMAFYNYLDSQDLVQAKRMVKGFSEERLDVVFRRNTLDKGTKTGSLYSAYNEAVTRAGQRYEFVNFIQADMQLVHWGADTESEIRRIFDLSKKNEAAPVLCVGTCFECRGKWTERYCRDNVVFDQSLESFVHLGVSMADVGVFSLERLAELGISFGGRETDMQNQLAALGFKMPKLRTPVSAFIPWPATVRAGKIVGRQRIRSYPDGQLLAVTGDYPSPDIFQNIWMENWIQPSGWKTLFPYWLSDTLSTKWFRRRMEAVAESELRLWSTVDGEGRISNRIFSAIGTAPSFFGLLLSALSAMFAEIAREIPPSLRNRWRGFKKHRHPRSHLGLQGASPPDAEPTLSDALGHTSERPTGNLG